MRQPEYAPRVPFTAGLLLVNAVVFIVECLMSSHPARLQPDNGFIDNYFALSANGIEHHYFWQLLTYQFMHAGIWHIIGNSLAIYVFGRELEIELGWKKYLTLFFTSGILGGIFQVAAALLWPQLFDGPVVGASAGAFGLVAAFALIYPDRELVMLLAFVIPVRMRAKTLLIFSGVLAGAGIVFSDSIFGGNVANAAHIGGMVMGVFFVRQILQGRWFQFRNPLRHEQPREVVATRSGEKKFWQAAPENDDVSADQFVQNEVDPILDKISAHGIQSLTERERKILEKARNKIR